MSEGGEALLVVDVDHNNLWAPHVVEQFPERQKVKSAIEAVLKDWRECEGLILHVILPHLSAGFSGQESQVGYSAPEKNNAIFGFLERGRKSKNASGRKPGCLVCDSGEESRLAEFIQHRCDIEPAFAKRDSDAFQNGNIGKYLHSENVSTVFLAGCNTSACIWATAKGALHYGFNVVLLADCSFPILENTEYENNWVYSVLADFPSEYPDKLNITRLTEQ